MIEPIPHVVIVGGGFAGLACARGLKRAPVRVTLLDAQNHHLFQPLLYQVATAALAAPDIAAPIRSLLASHDNTTVLARAVTDISPATKSITFDGGTLHYDYLVLAPGAVHHNFGHPEWTPWAPGLKTLSDAFEIRRRVLGAFEEAELAADPEHRRRVLTFAVVGGGPTGVELAGALAELARHTLRKQFRHFDPEDARIVLVEGAPTLLGGFPEPLAQHAQRRLEALGVTVRLSCRVAAIDAHGVTLEPPASAPGSAPAELIPARTVLWAAGVTAAPLGAALGLGVTRGGRVRTDPALHPLAPEAPDDTSGISDIYVCGDLAAVDPRCNDGRPIPGVAPAALQMGRFAAQSIRARVRGAPPPRAFRYTDKGQLATIGRMSAVAALGERRFSGVFAWLLWVVVHILYLAGFRNRLIVLFEWAWAWVTWSRPSRIVLEHAERWPPEPDQRSKT